MLKLLNLIDNRFAEAEGGQWLDVHEPATGEVYARLTRSGAPEVKAAVAAAQAAAGAWAALAADERSRLLMRVADLIEQHLQALAEAESRDCGKPLALAREVDIPRAVANFRFFAAAATQFASESHAMAGHAINYTLRQPLGVVACISPWNLPLYLLSWKIAPALAAGNCVIAKPSEVTPRTAVLLAELSVEAGLPAGVLNIVHGTGAEVGAALVADPGVRAVSFTGSTLTGAAIASATARQFKKLSLEMGGKNPTLVFADCDLASTVAGVLRSAFTNQGQVCLCGSRILVEDSIYEEFKHRLLAAVARLKTGDPLAAGIDQGAIVSEAHYRKIVGYLELAAEEGGHLLCGGPVKGSGRCAGGWFIEPVVIEGLPNRCRTNQEEIFGPVASLLPFSGEAEAVRLANESSYGLACSIWSNDLGRCHRVAAAIETGIVWINCWMLRDLRTPFGGVKSSGLGREGGIEAMRFFTEPKNVCIEFGHG
ncbi:MAG: aldehyde dehydrogenase family protein [Xanthomonadales bacterium]|nr:aldehyde dehydrogenase [Xanthomonadales bacterium]NIX13189.1 aldehyde dehydrogenase family protein [Xanthomonadales bacterium]